MNWLIENWQTVTALGIVALTVVIFAWRLVRPGNKSGHCGAGCGCGAGRKVEPSKFEGREGRRRENRRAGYKEGTTSR